MLLLILFLFSLTSSIYCDRECPNAPSISTDRRTNTSSLRIMQYNTEWLFIDYYASSDCPGNGCTWKNNSQATTHFSYVANVITPFLI